MSRKIEEAVERTVLPIVTDLGYELVDVEFLPKKGQPGELVVYIDSPQGIGLDDTEIVSRAIDEPLDRLDPIEDSYMLCVSSPGLDRPLKKERDFARAQNKKVDVKFYTKQQGKKEWTGELFGYTQDSITLKVQEKEFVFLRKDIAQIRLHIDF